jgi:PAS domain S-box-containing protein
MFYASRADLLDISVPYLRAGLEQRELCLWITCEPDDVELARDELRTPFPDAARYLRAGDLEIVSCRDWYLADGGFDPARVIAAWRSKVEEALARGYEGVRAIANEAWLTRQVWAAFAEYEGTVDEALAGLPIVVLCTYPLAGSTGEEIFDVARTHQFMVARRDGAWEVMETVESVATRAEVERLNAELATTVEARTRELEGASAALRESEELFRFIMANTQDVVTLYDARGRRVYISPSYQRVLGYLPDAPMAGTHPDDLPALREAFVRVWAGERTLVSGRHRHADGRWHWLESDLSLVHYRGQPHVLAATRDVTERRRLEEEFRQAQKMEAVGRLAGGVAHDFNNLLTAILGYAELVLDDLPADSPALADIAEIRMAAERAQGLTRQLLAFSRREAAQARVVDLAALVRGMERMLRLLVREDVGFELHTDGPVPVSVDPVQLEQILMNLVVNARDATPAGGRIVVELGRDGDARRHGVPDRPAGYARLVVSDTGAGMPPEVASRAFEPFFTTKSSGAGTGLGLSTVFGMVRQSGGTVWVDTAPGEGSAFTVLLPMTAEAEEEGPPEVAARPRRLAGLRVLVVEDDDGVRHLVAETLRRSEVEVLGFSTPAEALSALGDPRRPVDLLLTDLVLPGMSGPELVERIGRIRPGLPVVYMSGYTPEEEPFAHALRDARILVKPFGTDELLESICAATGC